MSDTMNCFSIDIEGFVGSNIESFPIDRKYQDRARENYEIEANMDVILVLLSDLDIRGTFFLLGRLAVDVPALVKKTAEAGHEIAFHGYEHRRLFGMEREEFGKELGFANAIFEEATGIRVYSFRASDFSTTASSLWTFDILKRSILSVIQTYTRRIFWKHMVFSVRRRSNKLIEVSPSIAGAFRAMRQLYNRERRHL